MIIFREKQYSQSSKRAVLEISSSGVKLTTGPSNISGLFNPGQWRCYKTRTKTRDGLQGGKMNIEFWKTRIVPVIERYLKITGGLVPCVATEWARECKNLDEVRRLMPQGLDLRVLSKQEESMASLEAYKTTTKRNLRDYSDVIIIDSGSLSTEITSIHGPWISVENNDPSAPRKIKSKFGYLDKLSNVLLVSVESLWDSRTGEAINWDKHDTPCPDDYFDWAEIRHIWKALGSRPIVFSGGTLGIGLLTSGMI